MSAIGMPDVCKIWKQATVAVAVIPRMATYAVVLEWVYKPNFRLLCKVT